MGAAATLDPPKADGGLSDEEKAELAGMQERALPKEAARRKELEAEAGEAVGAMPPKEPESEVDAPMPEKVLVKGIEGAIEDLGGKLPQEAVLKLAVPAMDVLPGEAYQKGSTIYFSGVARVVKVSQDDKLDKTTLTAVESVQVHTAKVVDLVVDKIVEP